EGRAGPCDHQKRGAAQVFPEILHAQTDAGHHHQAAGTVAEKAPAQPGALTCWHDAETGGHSMYEQNMDSTFSEELEALEAYVSRLFFYDVHDLDCAAPQQENGYL